MNVKTPMSEIVKNIQIRRAYPVKCLHCGFEGNATIGRSAIQSIEGGAEEWCPKCGYMALVGKDYAELKRPGK